MEWEVPNPLDALFLQKQYHYRGRAKISLHHLKFEDENVAGGRTVDPKNIARLVEVFESEGCLRLEAENHIPALIGETLPDKNLHTYILLRASSWLRSMANIE
jgi:hypothetical protein